MKDEILYITGAVEAEKTTPPKNMRRFRLVELVALSGGIELFFLAGHPLLAITGLSLAVTAGSTIGAEIATSLAEKITKRFHSH